MDGEPNKETLKPKVLVWSNPDGDMPSAIHAATKRDTVSHVPDGLATLNVEVGKANDALACADSELAAREEESARLTKQQAEGEAAIVAARAEWDRVTIDTAAAALNLDDLRAQAESKRKELASLAAQVEETGGNGKDPQPAEASGTDLEAQREAKATLATLGRTKASLPNAVAERPSGRRTLYVVSVGAVAAILIAIALVRAGIRAERECRVVLESQGDAPQHPAMHFDSAREVVRLTSSGPKITPHGVDGGIHLDVRRGQLRLVPGSAESVVRVLEISCTHSGFDPPTVGDNTCQTSGADTGIPCSTDADCTEPAECGLKSRYISITPANPGEATSIRVRVLTAPQFDGSPVGDPCCTNRSSVRDNMGIRPWSI